jgi:hypothetical protein
MRISDIGRLEVDDGVEWSARVTFADQERTLHFGGPEELVGEADASMFLAATLLPAMAWQQDLQIDGPVSPQLVRRVGRIARLYRAMDPTLRVPTVEVAAEVEPVSTGDGVACFFSRGIDSTYSAGVPRDEPGPLEQLVYCRTLEPLHDDANRAAELAKAHEVADRLGLPLRPIWTDLRSFTDPMLGWSTMHGGGLAAMALLVGQAFRAVVVPSAYDIASLPPAGSSPLLDPLFSSESVAVFHDHVDRHRQAKIAWLVEHRPELLDLVKVCYSANRVDNCGQCHKCLVTMAGLRAEGALHLAPQFPSELDLAAVRAQRVASLGVRSLWVPIVGRAEARGDIDLAAAVRDMLQACAVPPLGQVADMVRSPGDGFDPERSGVFERFDRVQTDVTLALVRHGEVIPRGLDPAPRRVRASTVVGSLAASIRHRRAAPKRLGERS